MMSEKTLSKIPEIIRIHEIKTLDITGGAPELHPKFKDLVQKVREQNVKVIDRCNLTILCEDGQEDTAEFLAKYQVEVIASLPCYLEENVDKQRGSGVFEKSIRGLKQLNRLGYGKKDSGLVLNLVYNPQGPKLPPSQKKLEEDYRIELFKRYGISFNNLLALANMPINRFAEFLKNSGQLQEYKNLLKENYNFKNLNAVMCKSCISVDWKGNLYDCDFNQQLGLVKGKGPRTIHDLLVKEVKVKGLPIAVGEHCFGCTAGSGSSCGGSLS